MDAFACKVSSLAGLGFAVTAILWRSKFPAFKAALLPSVITIVAFALGTICGLIASACWLQFTGTQLLAALRSAGLGAVLYSPLYILVMISKVECIARHMLMTVVTVTLLASGLLFGSYWWYANSVQASAMNQSVIIVCVTINLLGIFVGLQKADVGALFGLLIDIVLIGTLGLGIDGLVMLKPLFCVPFLTLCAMILLPCSWFTCRMALGCHRTLTQLVDKQTGLSIMQQPKPERLSTQKEMELDTVPGKQQDDGLSTELVGPEARREANIEVKSPTASRPPVTFPALPLKPPSEDFLAQTRHLFVIPNYNESLDLLENTLRVLAMHPRSQQRYAVLLAMEAAESGVAEKAYLVEEKFRSMFFWIGHTIHQLRPGELAGKGSNLNSAIQQLLQQEWASAQPDSIMLTIMDSDTVLSMEYITGVDWVWATNPKAVTAALLCPTTPLISNCRETPLIVRSWELFYFSCVNGQMGHSGNLRMPLACYSMLLTIPDEIGFWEPGLSGIAEDQHTALRTYIHFKRKINKGQIIAVLAPYWGQCELSFRCKVRQQIRHFFGFQDIWFALAKSQGLPLRERVHIFLTIASPILMATACPIAALGANIIFTYAPTANLRLWAFLISSLGLPQLPAACLLMFYVQYMWAFCEGVPVQEKRGILALLKLVVVFPFVFATQLVCGLYSKLWLLTSELGLAKIVYEGARQGPARQLVPV